ncbi:MAG: glycosyltransferase [Synechococcales cyanobacterium RM1_1_8]|nr:glycosyltransferase [Synechococcales cyanobacterium RM1_1_8]
MSIPSHLQTSSLLLSLVIPTYNEQQNLQPLVEQLVTQLDHCAGGRYCDRYELIVVDDNSPDRTWATAQVLMGTYPQLRVMRRQRERGLATAVIRGWQVAQGELLGVMDSDLQHPPQILPQLLAALAGRNDGDSQTGSADLASDRANGGAGNGAVDLAVASRHVSGGGVSDWSLARRVLSRGAQLLGLLLLPETVGAVSDPMSGYFVVRRRAIADRPLHPLGYKVLLEVLGRGSIRSLAEVGYVFQERRQGNSKVTLASYLDYLTHLLRLRWSRRDRGLRHQLRANAGRFLRFALVGLSGVFVDMLVLYLLSDPATLAWGLTRSKVVAAELAIVNNFVWNDRWTFRDLARGQGSQQQRLKRFLKFNLICLLGLGLNLVILNLLFNGAGLNRYGANLLAIACVTLWNFWMNLKLGWRSTETGPK